MKVRRQSRLGVTMLRLLPMAGLAWGCAAKNVDFSNMERPARAAELDAYDVFVGAWDWNAEVVGNDGAKAWSGTAEWNWTLDRRCLHGVMSAKCGETAYDAAGVWSWHPTKRKYIWWMFNNWGYPQEGTASYDDAAKTWKMDYQSVGLDGTTSFGLYTLNVADKNTLGWTMTEWADGLHTIKKVEMTGAYKRRR